MQNRPLKPILNNIFERLTNPETEKKATLVDCWPQIAGAKFSAHTKPRFASGKRVLVFVDDSTTAFELNRRYKPTILKRLKNQFGENEVKDVSFFVGELR
jgi:predicted nucleic acid-binding Zn ribbon protein